jgi:hypothetical protein
MENLIRKLFLQCCLWAAIDAAILGSCGCNTSSGKLTGPPDDFVVAEIRRYGGHSDHPISVHLTGEWTFQRDNYGTVLESKNADFDNLDQFIRNGWGAPKPAGFSASKEQQWVIPARVAGVSIWYLKSGSGVKISLVKPPNKWPDKPLY